MRFFLFFGRMIFACYGFAIALQGVGGHEVLAITFVVSSQAASRIGDPALWAARCVEPAHGMVASIVCTNWLMSNQTANTTTSLPFSANCTLALVQSPSTDPNIVIALLMQGARFNDTLGAANRTAVIGNTTTSADSPLTLILAPWHVILLIILASIWGVLCILQFVYYCICPRCCPLPDNDTNEEDDNNDGDQPPHPLPRHTHAYKRVQG